jgi:hypothetical protein
MINVIRDVISGRTANDVSPTNPLVRLDTAVSFLISRLKVGATEVNDARGATYTELQPDLKRSRVPRN